VGGIRQDEMTGEVAHHLLEMIDADCPSPFNSVSKLFPDEMYEVSRRCIEIGIKYKGGSYLEPGCELLPNLVLYNIYMVTKAVNDFGWYE
jgi:uroporphyrinogen-III decarboxylase